MSSNKSKTANDPFLVTSLTSNRKGCKPPPAKSARPRPGPPPTVKSKQSEDSKNKKPNKAEGMSKLKPLILVERLLGSMKEMTKAKPKVSVEAPVVVPAARQPPARNVLKKTRPAMAPAPASRIPTPKVAATTKKAAFKVPLAVPSPVLASRQPQPAAIRGGKRTPPPTKRPSHLITPPTAEPVRARKIGSIRPPTSSPISTAIPKKNQVIRPPTKPRVPISRISYTPPVHTKVHKTSTAVIEPAKPSEVALAFPSPPPSPPLVYDGNDTTKPADSVIATVQETRIKKDDTKIAIHRELKDVFARKQAVKQAALEAEKEQQMHEAKNDVRIENEMTEEKAKESKEDKEETDTKEVQKETDEVRQEIGEPKETEDARRLTNAKTTDDNEGSEKKEKKEIPKILLASVIDELKKKADERKAKAEKATTIENRIATTIEDATPSSPPVAATKNVEKSNTPRTDEPTSNEKPRALKKGLGDKNVKNDAMIDELKERLRKRTAGGLGATTTTTSPRRTTPDKPLRSELTNIPTPSSAPSPTTSSAASDWSLRKSTPADNYVTEIVNTAFGPRRVRKLIIPPLTENTPPPSRDVRIQMELKSLRAQKKVAEPQGVRSEGNGLSLRALSIIEKARENKDRGE